MNSSTNRSGGVAGAMLLCSICTGPAVAQSASQTNVVYLYPGAAPGSENWSQKESEYKNDAGLRTLRNVVRPSVTVYLPAPETAMGTSVIVAPGGAFRILSWDLEGTLVAEWLQRHGVAAFLLKYRLADTGTDEEHAKEMAARAARRGGPGAGARPNPGPQAEVRAMSAADGARAITVVRQRAAEWRLDPAKVGIMGFSAGGYVALQAALEHTPESRPAFVGAIYACCMNPAELKLPDDAPPTFFLHAYNDPVSVSSPALYMAWKAANKPAELHSFAEGGHGFGMPTSGRPTDGWIERFGDWLRYQKLMR